MYIYHLLNRILCLVLPLRVTHQSFSRDPETLLDLDMKIQSHFHAVERKKKPHSSTSGIHPVKCLITL